MEPTIQIVDATWIAVLRENLSAIKDDINEPKSDPPGMAQVIAP